jgi:diguanylate cyclase (GGDEF)-like protein
MPAPTALRQRSRTLIIAATVPLALAALADDIRIRHQLDAARKDPLSGLPGRPDLLAFTERLLHTERRDATYVLVLDAVGFKTVNDTFGHAAGDAVIRHLGQRLARWASGRQAIAARLGGDEFAVTAVLPHAPALAAITTLCEQLQQALTHDGRTLRVGMSVGIARVTDLPGEDASRIVRGADTAMYKVKTGAQIFPYLATREDAYADTVNGRRTGRAGTHLPVA